MDSEKMSSFTSTQADRQRSSISSENAAQGFRAVVHGCEEADNGEQLSNVIRAIAQQPADAVGGEAIDSPPITLTSQDMSRLRRLVHMAMIATSEMTLWIANAGHDSQEVD